MATMTKPKPGKPSTDEQRAAVAAMESEVVRRAVAGQSFYAIERELGITQASRVFKRAVGSLERSREGSYLLESMRTEALHEKAWRTLEADGLDSLAHRVADILREADDAMEWETVPSAVQAVIERAYADTYRAIPVLLKVGERRDKLDGLTHADRVADAQLEVNQASLQLMAAALVGTLRDLGLSDEQQRQGVTIWAERAALSESSE